MVACVLWLSSSVLAQVHRIDNDTPIPQIPKQLKPEEVIKADTLQHPVNMVIDSLPGGSRTGEYPFSPIQDSTFARALRLNVSPHVRFELDAAHAFTNLEIVRQQLEESPWQIAVRNMTIQRDAFRPDPVEMVNRQVMISKAMDANLYRPNSTQGFSATFEQIGSVLGLTEDVSPTLHYEVKSAATVRIVVYSTAASVIATIQNKVQQPGRYTVTWNLLDDKGQELADGDYVLEARIGDDAIFRKHVVIGSKP